MGPMHRLLLNVPIVSSSLHIKPGTGAGCRSVLRSSVLLIVYWLSCGDRFLVGIKLKRDAKSSCGVPAP